MNTTATAKQDHKAKFKPEQGKTRAGCSCGWKHSIARMGFDNATKDYKKHIGVLKYKTAPE